MSKVLMAVVLIFMTVVPTYGQNKECILNTAKDGDMIKVHASLLSDDMRIQPTTCTLISEYSIFLIRDEHPATWNDRVSEKLRDYFRKQGYDPFSKEPMLPMKRDRVFLEFERMRKETITDRKTDISMDYCVRCPKYKFTGEFEGKLRILPYPQNIKSGANKLEDIGVVRFTTRYYLNLTSIISFEAEEHWWLDTPLEKFYENGLKYIQDIGPTGRIIKVNSKAETEQE